MGQKAGALCTHVVTLLEQTMRQDQRDPRQRRASLQGAQKPPAPPLFSASLHTAGTARGQERVSNPAMVRRLQGGEEELATHVGQGGVNLGVTWGLVVTNNLGPSARVPSGHRGFSLSWQTLQQSWPVAHGAARDLSKQHSLLPPFETAHEWAAFLSDTQNHSTNYLLFTL